MKPDILKRVDEYLAKGLPVIFADTLLRELLTEHRRLKIIFRAKRRKDRLFDTPNEAADEIDRLRAALEEINADIKPEFCNSELELIAWWGAQVTRLQAIAANAGEKKDVENGKAIRGRD